MAAFPNVPIHIKTISDGTITTPKTNSLMDLPKETLAINRPTNGDHANHQE